MSISLKEKELDKAHKQFLEAKSLADDKNNHIRVLQVQKKAMEVRFKVIKNLIDNVIFTYK